MEFIIDNWVWFLVGGIIILMTIIGYIAEKTDFGRKKISSPEKKANHKEELEEIKEEVKPAEPEVQMALATDLILDQDYEPKVDENVNFDLPSSDEPEMPEEDLTVPFGDTPDTINEYLDPITFKEPVYDNYEISAEPDMDYFDMEQNSVADVVEDEPFYVNEPQDITNTNIELPDLESLLNSNNTKDTDEEDDVWKF